MALEHLSKFYLLFFLFNGKWTSLVKLSIFSVVALAGLSLTFAAEALDTMQFGIQMAAETENHMTSVERVLSYTQIDPEAGYNTDTQPPETWPTHGSLKLCDLSLAYLKGAPATLNNINISVAANEKVGVVGRTGAGKSSLVAALFRLPEPEGSVRTISFFWSKFWSRDFFLLFEAQGIFWGFDFCPHSIISRPAHSDVYFSLVKNP